MPLGTLVMGQSIAFGRNSSSDTTTTCVQEMVQGYCSISGMQKTDTVTKETVAAVVGITVGRRWGYGSRGYGSRSGGRPQSSRESRSPVSLPCRHGDPLRLLETPEINSANNNKSPWLHYS